MALMADSDDFFGRTLHVYSPKLSSVTNQQQHPITPPDELRRLWAQQAQRIDPHDPVAWMQHVSAQAAQWGADQELEACEEWLSKSPYGASLAVNGVIEQLHAARRPKPPSLKGQALDALERRKYTINVEDLDLLRRALEALPND